MLGKTTVNVWTWTFLVSNAVYWGIFFYLLSRRRGDAAALMVGILHMMLAAALSVAPFRSFVEPEHVAYHRIGLIHLEGQWVALATGLLLAWVLAAAYVTVAKGRGRWMTVVAVFDLLWAINLGGAIVLLPLRGRGAYQTIQLGENQPPLMSGVGAQLILLLFFVVPYMVSGVWALRRMRVG